MTMEVAEDGRGGEATTMATSHRGSERGEEDKVSEREIGRGSVRPNRFASFDPLVLISGARGKTIIS
jgi:hypothetical protein